MKIKDQYEIVSELLEATKELNGEYQNGWESLIEKGEELLRFLDAKMCEPRMISELIYEMNKKFPNKVLLEQSINQLTKISFINLITELGYRESKVWSEDEDEALTKLHELSNEFTKDILKEIYKYK